ncbi:hypothetical protein BJV77DRAFT_1031292 [Russula vinacea]|nr:hypothetical protein BJV77DRAFT_1031292 [Russula vinacea]
MPQSSEFSTSVHKKLLGALDIFNPSRLSTEDDIAVALKVLEDRLDNESIILCSLQPEYPYVLEFIMSSVTEHSFKSLPQYILDNLPSDANGFRASFGYQVLSRLSHSLSRLPYPSGQRPDRLDDYRRDIEVAPALLEGLSKLLQEGYLDEKNMRRGKTRQSKVTSAAHAEVNDKLFQARGRDAPRDRKSAEELIESTIAIQKEILEVHLHHSLANPDVARLVRSSYIRENVLRGNLSISDEKVAIASAIGLSPSLTSTLDSIRADLYFESAVGFGKWRMLCSEPFLRDLTRDGAQSVPVLKRLKELSLGYFSETNQQRLTRKSPIDIYRAILPGSVSLVYHVDVILEFGKDVRLILSSTSSILGIYSLDELIGTNWNKLGKHQARKGSDYVKKCTTRTCRGSYFDPLTFKFDVTETSIRAVSTVAKSPEKGAVGSVDEIHRLLDLEKYAILSQNVMRDILGGHGYPHVFQVSYEEKKVVECTRSSFVLGRGGTGKTTVIVFKIFGIERAWKNKGCVGPRPRQLFLTKSRLLAEKVEQDYRIQRWNSRRKKVIFNLDDTDGRRDDLPQKFSELRDSDFPLFLTLDTPKLRSNKKNRKWYGRTDVVTYDVFKRMYWPHFSTSLTAGVSSSLAFGEILGMTTSNSSLSRPLTFSRDHQGIREITGLRLPKLRINRDAYENFRDTHKVESKVDYSLFEEYQKRKLKRGERDLADRTHTLLNELRVNGLKGELVDFVYVDEVQDLLLIDTRLIISLCRNPDGLLWAGDTAQTISIGSTFTFKKLSASVNRYQRSIGALRGTPRLPERFQLLTNYRSHGGIRFPGAIDRLQPEAGVVGKELPQIREFFLSTPGRLAKLGHNQYKDEHKKWDSKYAPLIREVNRLWIVDYSHSCERIMRSLFDRKLVVELPIARNPLELFANESTSEEWYEEGIRLLNHRLFEEAFRRCAYQSREVARDIPESEIRRRREAFAGAARSIRYAAAARCYAEINQHRDVVRAFKLADMFAEAASYCSDNNFLDIATSIIEKHGGDVVRRRFFKDTNAFTNERHRLFESCKASANTVHAKYRKFYLGPVPHLLLCVEWIVTRAQHLRNAIEARQVEATLEEKFETLEEQSETLEEKSDLTVQHKKMRGILSQSRILQKRIKPGSNVHPDANLEGDWDDERHLASLRGAVTKTRDLFERLSDTEAPSDEFELAWNGIMPSRLRERKGR